MTMKRRILRKERKGKKRRKRKRMKRKAMTLRKELSQNMIKN
jgi:hypothetical protein